MVDYINLLNHKIDIILDDTLTEVGHLGRASLRRCEIKINGDMAKDAQASTLLHELVHIIADASSVQLSEQEVDSMGLGFLSLLKDNDDILEGLR